MTCTQNNTEQRFRQNVSSVSRFVSGVPNPRQQRFTSGTTSAASHFLERDGVSAVGARLAVRVVIGVVRLGAERVLVRRRVASVQAAPHRASQL